MSSNAMPSAGSALAPNGSDVAGAGITADPTTMPVAISLAPTTPARATARAATGTRVPCRGPGVIALGRGNPTRRLPLVALVPQWRQNYPNNRPPTRATAISERANSYVPQGKSGTPKKWNPPLPQCRQSV
jgi:hypothetical protein